MIFKIEADYKPMGDQPEAIRQLVEGVRNNQKGQVLLGVTGSGKTFTMANIIAKINKPTLILAHNKTLAAQLCAEFKEFFPNNAVEYFVYYDDAAQKSVQIPLFRPEKVLYFGQKSTFLRFLDIKEVDS